MNWKSNGIHGELNLIRTPGWHKATVRIDDGGSLTTIRYYTEDGRFAADRLPWVNDHPRPDRAFIFYRLMSACGWPSLEYWMLPVAKRPAQEWKRADLRFAHDMPVKIRVLVETENTGSIIPRVAEVNADMERYGELL